MVRAAALILACWTFALVGPAAARADELFAESGSLVMTQEPGLACCPAQSWSFATPTDTFKVWSYQFDPGDLVMFVTPPSGDFWRLEIAAPRGELLQAKTYVGATQTSFRAPGEPGIDIRPVSWCGNTVGDFTVHEVEYGPYSVITRFRASFTQYCGSDASAPLRGELDIVVPPVTRGPYQLDLQIDPTGTRHGGTAVLHGTIGCNAEVPVEIQGFLRQFQVGRYDEVGGSFVINMVCTGPSTPFTAVVAADGYRGHSDVPTGFQRGDLLIEATARAEDGIYAFPAETLESLTIALE